MIKFLCPFLITDTTQIPSDLVTKYDLGLEGVIFDGKELEKKFSEIKKNLIKVKKDFPGRLISLHYPTDNAEYIEGGKKFLQLIKFIELAQELEIEKIILHSNYFIGSDEFDQSKLKFYRLRYIGIFRKLDKFLKKSKTIICIENMPIIGNQGTDFDSVFVFPEDFNLFEKYKNIKINWDLGHWAITCKTLWDIKRFSSRTSFLKIDFFEYLKNKKQIVHFHLSSFSGNTFINTNALCVEGVPPARGDINELYFIKALNKINSEKKKISISLEINEKDYQRRKNIKETLTWLVKNKFITQT